MPFANLDIKNFQQTITASSLRFRQLKEDGEWITWRKDGGQANGCCVSWTMSHAESSLHWSFIHYKVTFEVHSAPGSETSIETCIYGSFTDEFL